MELIIERKTRICHTVLGQLSLDGEMLCDTLEHEAFPLPPGRYKVGFEMCEPLQTKCPTAGGIFLVSGHGVFGWRKPHIVVGKANAAGVMLTTYADFQYLRERVRMAYRRGKEITLTIIDKTDRKL